MSKTVLNAGMELPDMISEFTRDILSRAGDNSENPTIIITSGIRSPQRQASAMYENLSRKGYGFKMVFSACIVSFFYFISNSEPSWISKSPLMVVSRLRIKEQVAVFGAKNSKPTATEKEL